jgi:hypothetical protein
MAKEKAFSKIEKIAETGQGGREIESERERERNGKKSKREPC